MTEVRLRDAMPRPLLVAFVILALGTLAVVIALMIHPPSPREQPLALRHSPPKGTFTHDVGVIANAPVPSGAAPSPTCLPALRVVAGAAGNARLGAALTDVCRLAGGGTSAEAQASIRALSDVTVRFASFERTAEEATTDLASRTLYVNLRFARASTPTVLVVPVLLHEAFHLSRARGTVTALDEYRARLVEFEICKLLIDRDKWIRDCDDAQTFASLGELRAVELLAAAGYPR